jgi:hypothetical protein
MQHKFGGEPTPGAYEAAVATIVRQAEAMPPPEKVTRVDGRAGRFYHVEGDEAPYVSVTHALGCIAKPALINWAANQERTLVMEAAADLYLDLAQAKPMGRPSYVATLQSRIGKQKAHQREVSKASEIGSQVHGLIEWNLRRSLGQQAGPEPRVVDKAQWGFMAFQDWAASVNLKPIFIEQQVYSRTYKYAGTMDLLAEVNGTVALVDFKTGKSIYGEAYLQNIAYQQALIEMGHVAPTAGYIVRLPKVETDPAFEAALVPPLAELWPTFLAVLQVWKWWYAGELAYQSKRSAEAVA